MKKPSTKWHVSLRAEREVRPPVPGITTGPAIIEPVGWSIPPPLPVSAPTAEQLAERPRVEVRPSGREWLTVPAWAASRSTRAHVCLGHGDLVELPADEAIVCTASAGDVTIILTAPVSCMPRPKFDADAREQMARALARALLQQEVR